uniref:Uncharacterized protein n=1 Tax=viral metagenome TaxID=1070528 RepID=A0A6M3K5I6_9ZZZZ
MTGNNDWIAKERCDECEAGKANICAIQSMIRHFQDNPKDKEEIYKLLDDGLSRWVFDASLEWIDEDPQDLIMYGIVHGFIAAKGTMPSFSPSVRPTDSMVLELLREAVASISAKEFPPINPDGTPVNKG